MTREKIVRLVRELKEVFDIVRLVDVALNTQYRVTDEGEIIKEPYLCYAVWKKDRRCENCISAKVFARKTKLTKFEFVDHQIYFVTSMYVEVEDVPYALEMVLHVTDETLFAAYGKEKFTESISGYNRKLYVDPLTGAYNRRYYEEQLQALEDGCSIAMADVDNFKEINDCFGHRAGDLALQAVVDAISAGIRNTDAVVRYGGDEFLLIFGKIPQDSFARRLEDIRECVNRITLNDYPSLRLSISIGGDYCPGKDIDRIQEADRLLYKAKKKKNCVELKKG